MRFIEALLANGRSPATSPFCAPKPASENVPLSDALAWRGVIEATSEKAHIAVPSKLHPHKDSIGISVITSQVSPAYRPSRSCPGNLESRRSPVGGVVPPEHYLFSSYRRTMNRMARRNRRRESGTLFTDSYEGIGASGPRSADAPTLGSTLVLLVIQAVLSGVFIFVAVVSALITDSCSGRDCNFPLIEFSGWLAIVGIPAVFLISVGLCVLTYNRSRATWWIPLAGIAASLLVLLSSIGLLYLGVGPEGG